MIFDTFDGPAIDIDAGLSYVLSRGVSCTWFILNHWLIAHKYTVARVGKVRVITISALDQFVKEQLEGGS